MAAWHEQLRDTIAAEERLAVLRIKDAWHRLPAYTVEVGGLEIYPAVLQDGIRTPDEFKSWLADGRDSA